MMHQISMLVLTGVEAISQTGRPQVELASDDDSMDFVPSLSNEQKEGGRGDPQTTNMKKPQLTIRIPAQKPKEYQKLRNENESSGKKEKLTI